MKPSIARFCLCIAAALQSPVSVDRALRACLLQPRRDHQDHARSAPQKQHPAFLCSGRPPGGQPSTDPADPETAGQRPAGLPSTRPIRQWPALGRALFAIPWAFPFSFRTFEPSNAFASVFPLPSSLYRLPVFPEPVNLRTSLRPFDLFPLTFTRLHLTLHSQLFTLNCL